MPASMPEPTIVTERRGVVIIDDVEIGDDAENALLLLETTQIERPPRGREEPPVQDDMRAWQSHQKPTASLANLLSR